MPDTRNDSEMFVEDLGAMRDLIDRLIKEHGVRCRVGTKTHTKEVAQQAKRVQDGYYLLSMGISCEEGMATKATGRYETKEEIEARGEKFANTKLKIKVFIFH